ncbi:MAG: outer membrane protein assembly factor BamD, partial [Candidatus Aminicenantes bacterium]
MKRTAPKPISAALIPTLLLLGLVTGCGKKSVEIAPDLASSDEALYKLGEQSLKKDTEKALLYLRQVIDSFPKSFYAQRAKLLIADAYFRKGDESNMIL